MIHNFIKRRRRKDKSALIRISAITIGVRILGPAAGFILGSFCTRLYVDLSHPDFGPSDPKWVGAWYLGKLSNLLCIHYDMIF